MKATIWPHKLISRRFQAPRPQAELAPFVLAVPTPKTVLLSGLIPWPFPCEGGGHEKYSPEKMCKRHVLTICVLLASVRDFHARLPEGTRGEIAGQELRA